MLGKLLLLLMLICGVSIQEVKAGVCRYWQAEVDAEIDVDFEIDETDTKNILTGIECLLKLEGKKKEGLFSGATSSSVSQTFPDASIEVCALFYASFLFYQNWEHANAVALVDEDGWINSADSIKRAFKSYRVWLRNGKRIGLQKARERKLDPLADSGIRWY